MRDDDRAANSADPEDESGAAVRTDGDQTPKASLADDVAALVEDGKTLFEAEIGFQKTRLAFAANRSKSAILFGVLALGLLHLALIALIVGLVIALAPYVTAFGATAIVVGGLLLGTFGLMLRARNSTREIGQAFESKSEGGGE